MNPLQARSVKLAVDERTEGALYALQYEASQNGWTPHLWARTSKPDKTLIVFYATDRHGMIQYFDYAEVLDFDRLGDRINLHELTEEAKAFHAKLQEGFDRLDRGLDPVPRRHLVDGRKLD